MKLVTIIVFLCITLLDYGQERSTSKHEQQNVVGTNLTEYYPTVIGLGLIHYNIFYERFLSEKWTLSTSVAGAKNIWPSGGFLEIASKNTRGIRLELEGLRGMSFGNDNTINKRFHPFISLAFRFRYLELMTETFQVDYSTGTQSQVDVLYTAKYSTVAINSGFRGITRSSFYYNLSVGFGGQIITSNYESLLEFYQFNIIEGTDGTPRISNNSIFNPKFTFKIRFGWAF